MHLAENAIATCALYAIAEWDESETRRCEEEQEPIAVTLIPSEEMARLRLEYNARLTPTSGSPRGGSSLVACHIAHEATVLQYLLDLRLDRVFALLVDEARGAAAAAASASVSPSSPSSGVTGL